MPFSTAFVGFVDDEPVVHLAIGGFHSHRREARACRMVVLPEWQGAGVGMRFLNTLCQRELEGDGFIGNPTTTLFHTAHPGLIASLRRDPKWRQISAQLGGGVDPTKQLRTSKKWQGEHEGPKRGAEWGGHLRAVGGFRYYG